jgi:hypothetical protein
MTPSYRELRVINFEIEGSDFTGESISQTIYNFDLKIHEIVHKPAFMVNTSSQILFPSNDRILFGCVVAYFFDDQNEIPSTELLWDLVTEARDLVNLELESKTNSEGTSIQTPNKAAILPQLKMLILGGFRLN